MTTETKQRIRSILICVTVLAVTLAAVLLTVLFPRREGPFSEETTQLAAPVTQVRKGSFRVLVGGYDRVSGLADVLMLISLDRDTGEAVALQIPRDTYAAYTDGSYRKINGAPRALGGMAAFRTLLSESLGISIDRYLALSPDAFRDLVDALGGVEIELGEDMNYEDPAQGLSIHLKAGKQRLDGETAEEFVRYRSGYANGDLGRLDAQKLFLAALFRQLREGLSPMTVATLAAALTQGTETDLTLSDVAMLAGELPMLEAERTMLVTAPGKAITGVNSGASYYVLSAPAMRELLSRYFGADEAGFDPKGLFYSAEYVGFGEIYRQYVPYETFSAAQMA